ncbi:MAG: oligosaccharide repeat unit polymerase family protein [Methanothermobacter sp.]|nr:oligosaccharide repeat unit polymerase family protein [Methanothermobacter sp.]
MRFDVFSPYSLVAVIIIYLAMALAGTGMSLRGLEPPSALSIIYIVTGAAALTAGVYLSSWLRIGEIRTPELSESFLVAAVAAGLLIQAINLYILGGIPLFSGYLKARAVTKLWFISYLVFLPSINMLLAAYPERKYYFPLILGAIIFALTGYRTTVVVILLSGTITLYYSLRPSWRELGVLISVLAVAALLVGYVAVKSIEWQTWTLNPVELLLYRAGYTITVFDRILSIQGATGGKLLYYTLTGYLHSIDPRAIVGEAVLGYRHSTTSLIFGPALLDFGLHAMLFQMFIIGLILGLMHRIQGSIGGFFTGIYSILLAQTMVWVETGPTDLVVWIFYLIASISIIYVLWRCYSEAGSCS